MMGDEKRRAIVDPLSIIKERERQESEETSFHLIHVCVLWYAMIQ